ncbi:MAG TPA: ATP-binding protein [Aggregatilineaceae bacterium]|nr:ATP-binding protein [Aggregatilineaceae bacterium]
MNSDLLFQLVQLHTNANRRTISEFLTDVVPILYESLNVDVIVAYELIPETGGMPRLPAQIEGNLILTDQSPSLLNQLSHLGLLGQLIQRWEMQTYDYDSRGQIISADVSDPYIQFLAGEKIQSTVFLPLGSHQTKLGALLLNYRHSVVQSDPEWKLLEACGVLLGSSLLHIEHQSAVLHAQKSRMATAHTLYNEIANRFKGQIAALESDIGKVLGELGHPIPDVLTIGLAAARLTVFEVMRDLVIQASGDLLVDLRQMTLYKALHTVSAAIERAWPPHQRVAIEIHPIPPVIERQPLPLRQLLYALVLEIVGNAVKHGGPAPSIHVEMSWQDRYLYLRVIDHGHGFDVEKVHLSEHGLGFWQDLVEHRLAGSFQLSSVPGQGTVVVVRIPIIPVRRSYDGSGI